MDMNEILSSLNEPTLIGILIFVGISMGLLARLLRT